MNTATRFYSLSLWEGARVTATAEALTPTLSQGEREKEGQP